MVMVVMMMVMMSVMMVMVRSHKMMVVLTPIRSWLGSWRPLCSTIVALLFLHLSPLSPPSNPSQLPTILLLGIPKNQPNRDHILIFWRGHLINAPFWFLHDLSWFSQYQYFPIYWSFEKFLTFNLWSKVHCGKQQTQFTTCILCFKKSTRTALRQKYIIRYKGFYLEVVLTFLDEGK